MTYLTVEQLAKEFNLTKSWIRSKIFKGEIPVKKFGRLIRVNREEFLNWINSNNNQKN